ncbi:MAG: ADP-forming succinate--CoA ligase subunit beta [Zymomonas mobilis subsp. pomaceae]|uniref:Succinate--CoA ligase [ADP-forming] subunit beta n=1 Tax=Zymomonas mobilis subsp. pomaceae (strain ATCC 29192 / DSM 22645 / JCM 10191 / CCUG 17912 / NBRC 13757 / NCIMB 11200 / NRRL B-4491 / Barker I) TaxID=579138 RepID=F8EW90_ZYMMT|nr:ADP-forming succinate--CoA ligase subunit beta [Zymomonas mobilis]AEI38500.1 succinyl-CoA synthetase, beta subunit [Zymomonas mobilis subsp. pomaceae ATCC 29192]MDX5948189.1 ADP-forming succinate--CoA ligase subunit beta [Zymomonas mobilis subsp. pomaceae]GEB89871.1 succinate--CoA ligase [ADP-forming] subunit beta [Zymomonas mobilis subsp. pomaceae]
MNIYEYQAMALLGERGVPVVPGHVATTIEDAITAAEKLSGPSYVIKSQILAGGRGKGHFWESPSDGGGVRIARDVESLKNHVTRMLGKHLVTAQTDKKGILVEKVFITEAIDIVSEYYLSLLVDRQTGRITFVVSPEGGMDIEAVARDKPEAIHRISVDPATGFQAHHGRAIGFALGLKGDIFKQSIKLSAALYKAFVETDMSLLEINPLVETGDGKLLPADAKVSFDDNALFRHPDIAALGEAGTSDPLEQEAKKSGLSYIKLDGSIGCMVNGAGLAMGTMDIIQLHGEMPANFLDVGGGASREKVATAFRIILSDPSVKGILINIFGGIMRCDILAEGIIAAARELDINVPLVVRLEGNNVKEGKAALVSSGLAIITANDLGDAAEKIVAAIQKAA